MVGIYPNVPFEEYKAWDAINQSALKQMFKSPAHVRLAIEGGKETLAMREGSAIHTALLEPAAFDERYEIAKDGRTKAGKEQRSEATKCLISESTMNTINQIVRAVGEHKTLSQLLDYERETELSLVWDEDLTRCKTRIDCMIEDIATIVDIKTTEHANIEEFVWTIRKYRYDYQAAFMLRGAKAMGFEIGNYLIAAIEKTPPFGIAVYRLDDDDIRAADRNIRDHLVQYARCCEANSWPCYPDSVNPISFIHKKEILR